MLTCRRTAALYGQTGRPAQQPADEASKHAAHTAWTRAVRETAVLAGREWSKSNARRPLLAAIFQPKTLQVQLVLSGTFRPSKFRGKKKFLFVFLYQICFMRTVKILASPLSRYYA